PKSIAEAFDTFAGDGGRVIGVETTPEAGHTGEPQGDATAGATGDADAGADAANEHFETGSKKTGGVDGPPTDAEGYARFVRRVIAIATTPDLIATLAPWWASEDQRKTRNACGVTREDYDALAAEVAAAGQPK